MADPNNSDELNAKLDELIRSLAALTDSVQKSASASASAATAAEKSARASVNAAKAADKSATTANNSTKAASKTRDNTQKPATSLAGEIAKQIQKAAAFGSIKQARAESSAAKKVSAAKGQAPSVQAAAGAKAFAASQARHSAILGQASKSVAELGASFGKLGSLIRQGSGGVGDFAENLQSSAKPVLDFAAAIGGPGTKAVAFFGEQLLKLGVAAAKQAQKELVTYQKLSAAGVGAVGSLDGLRSLAFQLNYSTETLGEFSSFLTSNSKTLAMFAGGATEGAKVLGNIASDIEQSGIRDKLYALGQGYEAQNQALMNFALNETRMGRSRQLQEKGAAQSFAELNKNLIATSRLTGQSVEQQQESNNRAMAVEQFRIKLEQAKEAGDEKEIARLTKYQSTARELEAIGAKDVASALLAQAGGFITPGSKGLQIATGGQATQEIESGVETDPRKLAANIVQMTTQGMTGALGTLGLVGGQENLTGLNVGQTFDARDRALRGEAVAPTVERGVAGRQDKEFEREADRAGKALKSAQNVSDFFGTIIPTATTAVQKFTNVIKGLTDMLPGAGKEVDSETGKTQQELMRRLLLPGFADGGIAKGPDSGHIQLLHGNEAVIPLKGGNIPVQLSGGKAGLGQGPVFDPKNETNFLIEKSNEELVKSNVTLDKILTAITGGAAVAGGGAAAMSQAMDAHDASHKHEPPTISPDAAKELGKGIGSPLETLKVTSGFGMRTDPFTGKQAGHGGVDLAGKLGDLIKAPEGGTARVRSEKESGGYGNMVEILNDQGKVIHRMAHMSEAMVKTGDKIAAGSEIGKVGSTGRSTGAHLHWEQFDPKTGMQVDPLAALAAKQGKAPGFGSTAGGAATGYPQMVPRGRRGVPGMADGLGSMSEKYETGGRGSGTVGYDTVGGTSYGKYQIASKVGAMTDFLKFAEKSGRGDVSAKLRAAGAETDTGAAGGKAADVWKQMAAGGELGDLEHQFIKQKSYEPAMAGLKDAELKKKIESSKALQEMMWSTSVQHGGGGAAGIMNKIYKKGMSEEDLVKATYAERGTRFGGSTAEVQKGVKGRFASEEKDVMAMLGAPGQPAMAAGAQPGQTTTGSLRTALGLPEAGTTSPMASLTQSVMGMLGLGGAPTAAAGITAGGAPGAIGSDISAITQAMEAQTSAITSGMENLTTQLVDKLGTGAGGTVGDPAVPTLLSEILSAQRDQITAINKLIQVSTA